MAQNREFRGTARRIEMRGSMNLINVPRDIRTQRHLRAAFWSQRPLGQKRVPRYTQNDYATDVRCAWVEFVDSCARDGRITPALARRATL